jgi:hypothetical protein
LRWYDSVAAATADTDHFDDRACGDVVYEFEHVPSPFVFSSFFAYCLKRCCGKSLEIAFNPSLQALEQRRFGLVVAAVAVTVARARQGNAVGLLGYLNDARIRGDSNLGLTDCLTA